MRLITENDTLLYDESNDYDFLDSSDVTVLFQVIPTASFFDAIRVFLLRKYYAEEGESLRLAFSKKLNCYLLEIMKLNNYDKYNHKNLCPIEYVVRHFFKAKNNWMLIYKRNEYSTKIISGSQDIILNTRCVPTYTDLNLQIDQTIKFINRRVKFDNIEVVSDIDISTLLDFAKTHKVYNIVYGKRNLLNAKCNTSLFVSLLLISVLITGSEYHWMSNSRTELQKIDNEIRTIKQFGPYGIPEFFNCISTIKSPLVDLKKIRYFGKDPMTAVVWNKKTIKIKDHKNAIKQFEITNKDIEVK